MNPDSILTPDELRMVFRTSLLEWALELNKSASDRGVYQKVYTRGQLGRLDNAELRMFCFCIWELLHNVTPKIDRVDES